MFSSALGYLLTLFMAFTIIPIVAFFMRVILVIIMTRIYWAFKSNKSPMDMFKFSIQLAQPVGFITAIFHGYAAVWMGVVFLKGLDVTVDWFLPIVLGVFFTWFGLQRLQSPPDVKVESRIKLGEQDTGDPDVVVIDNDEEVKNLNKDFQEKIKEQSKEMLLGNTIVGLIGKITGLVLGALKLVLPMM